MSWFCEMANLVVVVGDNGKLLEYRHLVLGACWGTEELGWNERSREEITRREITINGFENYEL